MAVGRTGHGQQGNPLSPVVATACDRAAHGLATRDKALTTSRKSFGSRAGIARQGTQSRPCLAYSRAGLDRAHGRAGHGRKGQGIQEKPIEAVP